ncbi:hypothetical protein OG429_15235 [Streptomyces sp. NBC_00190]|uniref:hypothetical protein n=1 Tax=unclassified Streptomyces TaxID=2593676 RepID=UPI002E2CB87B|nr:hypothetical protein [Streptomyces sp. NBC_00190]WSZ40528.1 hypothetical protein OG239_17915 [Streptomyces sp. NBC_00868]
MFRTARTARFAAVAAVFAALCAGAFTTTSVTASAESRHVSASGDGSINWDTAPTSIADSINWD